MTGTCGENLTWTLNHATLTISGNGDMYDNQIFSEETAHPIEQVIIESGVTSVGKFAFFFARNRHGYRRQRVSLL